MADLLLSVGVVFLFLSLHPFIFYPLSLKLIARFWPKPLKLSERIDMRTPSVALCLCAYNEEAIIAAKIVNMLALREQLPALEIWIYIDSSTDRTAEIVSIYKEQLHIVISSTRTGKTVGMNLLVRSTTADIVVFTDANVMFAPDALVQLLKPFADPSVGCTLGHLKYVDLAASATSSTGSLYWRREENMKELETTSGSAMTADGAIFAIRRVLHDPPPPVCADDIYLSLSVLCSGYRVVRVGDAIAYEDISGDAGQEFKRKVRIGCLAYSAHRLLWPRLRQLGPIDLYKYVSHKLLRWLTIYSLVLSGLCFVLSIGLIWGAPIAIALGASGLAAFVAAMRTQTGPIGKVGSVLQAFVATGVGVWKCYAGSTYQIWASPVRVSVAMHPEITAVTSRDASTVTRPSGSHK